MSNIETSGASGRYTGAVELGVNPEQATTEQQQEQQPTQGQEHQPPVDWEKRFKDAQSELTKLQQEKADREKATTTTTTTEEQPREGEEQPAEEQRAEEADADKPEEGEEAKDGEEQDLEAEIAAKVDVPKYEAEFTKDGKLSDESYAELEGKGFSKDDVDDFIAFRQERNQRFVNAISDEVGGNEAWADVQAWAKESMSEADRDAFNKGMADAAQKRDLAAAKLLAAGVMQRFEEANGHGSRRSATGGAGGGGGADSSGYASKAEWQAEMRSNEYKNNPLVREQVDAKLQRSVWYKAQHGL